jgi:hypothetical protein
MIFAAGIALSGWAGNFFRYTQRVIFIGMNVNGSAGGLLSLQTPCWVPAK